MMERNNKQEYRRRSIRLKYYDYSQPGAYFITICIYNRESLFGEIKNGEMVLNEYGEIAKREWMRTGELRPEIIVDEFIIMPNHLHGILIIIDRRGTLLRAPMIEQGTLLRAPTYSTQRRAPTIEQFGKPTSNSIPTIIRGFKSTTTRQINQLRNSFGKPVWQRNYYEHIIRNEGELNKIREYIINNPLQWEFDIENPSKIKEYKNITDYFNERIK